MKLNATLASGEYSSSTRNNFDSCPYYYLHLNFRLFLHTTSNPTRVPAVLAAYTVVINYRLLREDIEEELLDRFLVLAKPRVDSEKFGLLQVISI